MNTVKRFLILAAVLQAALCATTITQGCGSVGTGAQNQPGPPFPPFSPSISATLLGCPAFTAPVGNTITDVQLTFQNDWQLGANGLDTLVFSYSLTGFNIPGMVATVSGTGLTGSMPPAGAIPISCPVLGEIITCDDPVGVAGIGAIGITVNAVWAMGGLDFSGSEGTTVSETLTYSPLDKSGTPEPSALVMAGSGIIGLALVLRRHQRRSGKCS